MDSFALADHLLNFVAPAPFMALLLALLGPAVPSGGSGARFWFGRFWRAFWINSLLGVLVLVVCLVLFGRDGEMAGYAALTVTVATSQWLLRRGWEP